MLSRANSRSYRILRRGFLGHCTISAPRSCLKSRSVRSQLNLGATSKSMRNCMKSLADSKLLFAARECKGIRQSLSIVHSGNFHDRIILIVILKTGGRRSIDTIHREYTERSDPDCSQSNSHTMERTHCPQDKFGQGTHLDCFPGSWG